MTEPNHPGTDPFIWVMYGLLTLTSLLLAWGSGKTTLQKLAIFMLISWSGSNIAVSLFGLNGAPIVIQTLDALIAVLIATLGVATKSKTALLVVILFLFEAVTHIVAFSTDRAGSEPYYLVLNMIFVLQLCMIGGASASACWASIRDRRFLHHSTSP